MSTRTPCERKRHRLERLERKLERFEAAVKLFCSAAIEETPPP